jgi:lipopolysaccharide export system protein LptA
MNECMTTRAIRRIAVAALAALLLLAAAPASAQKAQNQGPPNALQGFSQNRNEPVKIQAASLEVRDKDRMATFTGDVHVVQGDTEMRCKALVVFYDEDPNAKGTKGSEPGKQIRKIEVKGGVTVTQKDQNATGDSGIFDMLANTVTLNGNVIVTRGTDVIRGQRLFVDLGTGVTKMDGTGRVEGLFSSRSAEKK